MGYHTYESYVIQCFNDSAFNMLDSTTYYLAHKINATASTLGRWYIPRAGTIRRVTVYWYNNTADCTAENTSFKIDISGTPTAAFYTGSFARANSPQTVANLNAAVAVGDFVSLQIDTPAWVTNPEGVYIMATIEVQC